MRDYHRLGGVALGLVLSGAGFGLGTSCFAQTFVASSLENLSEKDKKLSAEEALSQLKNPQTTEDEMVHLLEILISRKIKFDSKGLIDFESWKLKMSPRDAASTATIFEKLLERNYLSRSEVETTEELTGKVDEANKNIENAKKELENAFLVAEKFSKARDEKKATDPKYAEDKKEINDLIFKARNKIEVAHESFRSLNTEKQQQRKVKLTLQKELTKTLENFEGWATYDENNNKLKELKPSAVLNELLKISSSRVKDRIWDVVARYVGPARDRQMTAEEELHRKKYKSEHNSELWLDLLNSDNKEVKNEALKRFPKEAIWEKIARPQNEAVKVQDFVNLLNNLDKKSRDKIWDAIKTYAPGSVQTSKLGSTLRLSNDSNSNEAIKENSDNSKELWLGLLGAAPKDLRTEVIENCPKNWIHEKLSMPIPANIKKEIMAQLPEEELWDLFKKTSFTKIRKEILNQISVKFLTKKLSKIDPSLSPFLNEIQDRLESEGKPEESGTMKRYGTLKRGIGTLSERSRSSLSSQDSPKRSNRGTSKDLFEEKAALHTGEILKTRELVSPSDQEGCEKINKTSAESLSHWREGVLKAIQSMGALDK